MKRQLIYTILLLLVAPFWLCISKVRQFRHPFRFPNMFKHRKGIIDELKSTDFWVHAVSSGEVNSAESLIHHLLIRFPDREITLTCGAANGIMHAAQIQQQPYAKDRLQIAMMPFDYPKYMQRFLDKICPKILIGVESNYFWPNFITECHHRNIPMFFFSLSMGRETFWLHKYITKTLFSEKMNLVKHIYVQAERDCNRLQELGVEREKITIGGNLKFVVVDSLKNEKKYDFSGQISSHSFVWTAGSTYRYEEEMLWDAHKELLQQCPDALLIYAPRQALSFTSSELRLVNYCEENKLRYATVTGKDNKARFNTDIHILLINAAGMLRNAYAVSQVAFVGGSLVKKGGHNALEPANFSVATISGPHYFDQYQIYDLLLKDESIIICDDLQQLKLQIKQLHRDKDYCRQKGQAMKRVFNGNVVDLYKFSNTLKQWLR